MLLEALDNGCRLPFVYLYVDIHLSFLRYAVMTSVVQTMRHNTPIIASTFSLVFIGSFALYSDRFESSTLVSVQFHLACRFDLFHVLDGEFGPFAGLYRDWETDRKSVV